MSLLVVMGSGETAPTMVRPHRAVLERTGGGPAAFLDTPFGFQENADELTARTLTYFRDSVGRPVEVARWRRADDPLVERERALDLLHRARWAFAGPGSPTYALRQWLGTPVPGALHDVVARGGTLVLGSAAAVTTGAFAIPVYEVYKVGQEPAWVEGLDVLGSLTGLRAAVVPHYDNSEGGTHDTRFCYLGERRLALLEELLPADVGVLGVDEHTALVVDVAARTVEVLGTGGVTVRRRGASRVLPSGSSAALEDLAGMLRGETLALVAVVPPPGPAPAAAPAPSLAAETARAQAAFDAALVARDVDAAVAAVLGLEDALAAWSTDMQESDEAARARRALRSMVVRLGGLAVTGARDPRDVVGPYVGLLLELRARARQARDFAASDLVRDRLAAAGVEVRDTPEGATWHLTPASLP